MFNIGLVLLLFLFFWFLNSGFSYEQIWLIVQASFFAIISLFIFKYKNIKLMYWFLLIGLFYLTSMVLEIFKIGTLPEILASTGFGILTILIISEAF